MTAAFRRSVRAHGLSWLWWLACLLPLAQFMAVSHAASHGVAAAVAATPGEPDEPRSSGHAHCGICLSASTLGAGAMPAPPAAPAAAAALPDWSGPAPALSWRPGLAPVYRSRAPPSAPR